MPLLNLPEHPDLDHLLGQARELQRQVRSGEPTALTAVRLSHPRPEVADDPAAFRLTDAQMVTARQYGMASWPALRRRVEMVVRYSRAPSRWADHQDGDPADRLLALGCLVYGGDDLDRHARAGALLAEHPELAGASIHTAAAVGDVAAATRLLAAEAGLADRCDGPFDWEPLLYLAYSRIDPEATGHDAVAVARLLLAAGADPNAGYLWEGEYPFTALCGVLGGGEDQANQPPHGQALELARLLLEAGADPNDSQALYNRQFTADASHLALLIEFGLGTDRRGPWHARLESGHGTPAQLLEDALSVAASENRPEWARLALAAGADPDGRGTRHPLHQGLTPYDLAVRRGNREVAAMLAAAGATATPLDPVEEFLAAGMAGDRAAVDGLLAARPGLARDAVTRRPDAILAATEMRRPEVIRLLAGLGFDVNVWARITPLHQAAYDGDITVVETLLELGADPENRDFSFNATPLGWAEHNRHEAVVDLLRRCTRPGDPAP